MLTVIWHFDEGTWNLFLKFKNVLFAENKENVFKKLHAPASEKQDSKEEAEEVV